MLEFWGKQKKMRKKNKLLLQGIASVSIRTSVLCVEVQAVDVGNDVTVCTGVDS